MEMETGMSTSVISTCNNMSSCKVDEEDDEPLPGFRFHPTDEELVGFYLKRKVEKRPVSIELIKQIDIYKFDPWDLPKASNVGDKEWYFFCKRGRKYRNSIRPNRVTGSGFWKATGIDRPIYSAGEAGGGSAGEGSRDNIIGLKKSLVYYRGSAGKGTKTDWMMHEFRLPSEHDISNNTKSTKLNLDAKDIVHEAEVWTLCRIFKRNVSYKKCIPELKELSSGGSSKLQKTNNIYHHDHAISSSRTHSNNNMDLDHHQSNYISFSNTTSTHNPNNMIPSALLNYHGSGNSIVEKKPYNNINLHGQVDIFSNYHHQQQQQQQQQNKLFFSHLSSSPTSVSSSVITPPVPTLLNNYNNNNVVASNQNHFYHGSKPGSMDFSELLKNGDWDELRSLFECGAAASASATPPAPAAPMFL